MKRDIDSQRLSYDCYECELVNRCADNELIAGKRKLVQEKVKKIPVSGCANRVNRVHLRGL